MILLVLSVLTCIFIVFYKYMTWNHNHWKKVGISYDEPSFPFGSVRDSVLLRRNRAEVFNNIYNKFPNEKIVGFYNIRKPGLLIRDPELARRILISDFHHFRNNDVDASMDDDPITGRNLFVLKDDEWKRSRALVSPAFSTGRIKALYPQLVLVAKDLVQYLKNHPEELHMKDTMSRYTTEMIAKCAFGIDGNSFKEEKPKIFEVGKSIFVPSVSSAMRFMIMLTLPFFTKIFNIKLVNDDVVNFFDSILHDVIQYRQKKNVERNDLVQYLIDLKRKTEEVEKGNVKSEIITRAYTDEDILAGCVMFFVEAYETTALTLAHVLYLLAINKDAQEKLRQEIDQELKKGELTYESLNELQYMNAVIMETNRIMPAGHILQKRCSENYVLDTGDKKIPIKKNDSVFIALYGIQTDYKYWDDALEFKPERFLNKEKVTEIRSKGLFFPFGDGPRQCVGLRLATTVIKVGLFYILSELEILPTSRSPKKLDFDPTYLMMTQKGGIHLKFTERSR